MSGAVFGTSNRLWALLGGSLAALQAPRTAEAFSRDGYVPSWLARSWGDVLFERLGELVVVCRPGHGGELRPLAVYQRDAPAGLRWARAGEQLSVYDLPLAAVLLRYAQFCSGGSGHTTTTLRPAAPGTPVSEVAARTWQARSGLFPDRTSAPPRPRAAPVEKRTA